MPNFAQLMEGSHVVLPTCYYILSKNQSMAVKLMFGLFPGDEK